VIWPVKPGVPRRSPRYRARFVALSAAKLKEWLAADLSPLDLLVIQIDGLRVGDHVLLAAIGIDGAGDKHVLAVALGRQRTPPWSRRCWPT
jgi:putative transposase